MKKKIFALLITAMLLVLAACGSNAKPQVSVDTTGSDTIAMAKENLKVGFVYIGTINDEGYTQAHDQGRLALEEMDIKTMYVDEVPENADCEKAIRYLIDQGCNVIYANSAGYMDYVLKVAKEYPDVKFGQAAGTTTAKNVSTYMGRIEQPRYLSGIVAGMKTRTNKIGYVAAMPIPEVIRGINAFTLGVQSVNPDATVEVIWTNTWFDPAIEKQAADDLLNKGIDVLAQHQNSIACQVAAQEKDAFAIGYNISTPDAAPQAYLTAPLFHWEKFYVDDVQHIIDDTWTSRAYWEGLSSGIVSLDVLSDNCAPGTDEVIAAAQEKIESGELDPFSGPIEDQDGQIRVAEGAKMTDTEQLNCDWFVKGVIGTIPQ